MASKNVAVFCASSDQVDAAYLDEATRLGHLLADCGWTTVYGGGGTGLMGALARAVLEKKGRIIGVRPTFISDFEGDQLGLDELIQTRDMHERVGLIFEKSDAFVVLPGSCGTLDELMQTVTWKRLGLHNKPVAIINTHAYFDPVLNMFRRMTDRRFVTEKFHDLYEVYPNAASAVAAIANHQPQPAAVL